ncbi:MAG: DUF523 domain-containing protein [Halanaerobiales bacterium]
MYIVSACLAGINCRYNGGNTENKTIKKLVQEGKAIPVCPEVLGGLDIPREPCEIINDKNGDRRVINSEGNDVTEEFTRGAEKTLEIARIINASIAILQSRSPSCGYKSIYDGTFDGNLIKGNGITADLLEKNTITIYTEEDIEKIDI